MNSTQRTLLNYITRFQTKGFEIREMESYAHVRTHQTLRIYTVHILIGNTAHGAQGRKEERT